MGHRLGFLRFVKYFIKSLTFSPKSFKIYLENILEVLYMFLLHAHGAEESFLSEVLLHGLLECARILPFLFITYLLMEYIEHRASARVQGFISRAGGASPVFGGLLGIVPQCGFSAAAANLYSGKIITLGTLIAVFLSTSDEMLPILISGNFSATAILSILGYKAACAIICGVTFDLVMRKIKGKNSRETERFHNEEERFHEHHSHEAEHHHGGENHHENHHHNDLENHDHYGEENGENHSHQDLEKDAENEDCHICHEGHSHCDRGIFPSAIFHTFKTAGFLLFITLLINSALYFIGEEALFAALPSIPVLSHLLAAIFGLIPNCAASVALTSLAASGIISSGEMMAGLFSGAGVGLAVFLKNSGTKKEKIQVLALLVLAGVAFGIFADLILPNVLFW